MSKIYIGVDEVTFERETNTRYVNGEIKTMQPFRKLNFMINGEHYSIPVRGEVEILGDFDTVNKLKDIDGFKAGDAEYDLYAIKEKEQHKQYFTLEYLLDDDDED